MNAPHDDLLRPTLTAGLDVRTYRPLFAPQSILWPCFFGGPLAGGILFGMNYARMGRRDLAKKCWVAAIVITLALGTGMCWYILQQYETDSSTRPSTRGLRYVTSGVGVAIGWLVAKHQQPLFTAWENAGNRPAGLWIPGVLACVVGALFTGGLIVAGLASFGYFG